MKKKILSLALVVAMLASMLVLAPTSGAVEAQVNVWTTDAVGSVGQTVSVDIMMTTTEDVTVYGYQLGYTYDSTKLRLDSVTYPIDEEVGAGTGSHTNKNGEVFGGVCAAGPFDVIGRTYAEGFEAKDTAIATLHFTALAAGSVEVGMVPMTVENGLVLSNGAPANCVILDSGSTVYYEGSEIACGGSTVTVLPEGYISTATNLADFTTRRGTVSAYKGNSTGTVVLPAMGSDDKEITKLGEAFMEKACSSIIIPAFVTTIADYAVDLHMADVKIYILNPSADIGADAFFSEDYSITVCGYAGSTAEEYATDAGYDFEAINLCELTVDGISTLVPANTKAPSVLAVGDGKVAIGWTDGVNTYAPGAPMTLTGATVLTPVTITAPVMNAGVYFKMGATIDKCQMRFTTNLDKAAYEELAKLGTVTMGTLITPAKYVSLAGGFTREALDKLSTAHGGIPTYIDVAAKSFFEETETSYVIAGSLAGFKAVNIDVDYAAAFYVTVTFADNSSITVYTNFDLGANRSVNEAITAATNVQEGFTDTEAGALRKLIAGN